MEPIRICEIVTAVGGALWKGNPNAEVTSVSTNSRELEPGALFVPIVLACTILRCMAESWDSPLFYALYSVAGAVAGGGVLLAAALATKGGIGGGDIKLAALIGLFYGPHGMLLALLTGTPIAIFYGLIKRRRCGDKKLHIAFVPFITIGCFLTSIILVKGVYAL